jgi:hypothetical protein
VFCRREQEGFLRLGWQKLLIPQLARKMACQDSMIRLADQNKMIALFLNDHGAALFRSVASRARLLGKALEPGGGLPSNTLLVQGIMPSPRP